MSVADPLKTGRKVGRDKWYESKDAVNEPLIDHFLEKLLISRCQGGARHLQDQGRHCTMHLFLCSVTR